MADERLDESSQWLRQTLSESKAHGLSYVGFEPFLSDTFDPQEYANAIIDAPAANREGRLSSAAASSSSSPTISNWVPQSGRVEGDLSLALGRLNLAIDDVDRLVRDEVTKNATMLLAQTNLVLDLRPTLSTLNTSLEVLEGHQSKLVSRITAPRQALQQYTSRLSHIRMAHSLVRRAQRLIRLLRRLQTQMQSLNERRGEAGTDEKSRLESLGEEEADDEGNTTAAGAAADELLDGEVGDHTGMGLSRAALTLAEISIVLNETDQSSAAEQGGTALDKDRENQRQRYAGSDDAQESTLRRIEASSSLLDLEFVQEYMPMVAEARERVTDLMESMIVRGLRDLSPSLLSTSLQTAFNLGQLTDLVRDLLADLTDVVRDRVHAAFDMQTLSHELGSKEPQVQHATSYRARRGEFSSALHQRWTIAIWSRLETLIVAEMGAVCSKVYTLERVLSLKKDSSVVRTTYLERAMNVLGDRPSAMFWSTLADAIDREARQSPSPFLLQTLELGYPRLLRIFQEFYAKVSVYTGTSYSHTNQSPETLVILRSLARFEDSFLAKSSARFEQMFTSYFTSRQVPGAKEGAALANLAMSEIDSARLDPLLLHAVGKNVCDWLAKAIQRIEDLAIGDGTTQHSVHTLTPAHTRNASLTMASYQLGLGLLRAAEQGPPEYKAKMTELSEKLAEVQQDVLIEPLLNAICKDISDIMSRMHYVDFSLDRDAVSGSGSAYMADLSDRMWFVREQLFVQYDMPMSKWLIRIGQQALHVFVMQASLIRPLAEGGKLKLTSDMTELEFSVSQLLASARQVSKPLTMNDCGQSFAALRAFRHLLFTDVVQWMPIEALQAGLSPLAALHHVIARSSTIALPHELHKWTRVEYIKWLDNHTTQDGVQLVQGCIDAWKAGTLLGNGAGETAAADQQDDEVFDACLNRILAASAATTKQSDPKA